MNQWRERIARRLAPGLKGEAEIRTLVADEVKRAMAAIPVNVSYDPKGEGYRPASGSLYMRNLLAVDQSRMFEIAYFMYDSSAMTKRLAHMDKGFLFSDPITITADDDDVRGIVDRFWKRNKLDLKLPANIMWLGILGEQCWPVEVSPHNGDVKLLYEDPAYIKEVYVNRMDLTQPVQVEMLGLEGRTGRKMAVIRQDESPYSKAFEKLVGDCFFVAINHPPNSPRGRSDYLTLFDWIDGLEKYGFNYLERSEFMLNFVWDVMLKGMDENQIRDWLRNNPPPEPGSLRAHNENVTWDAVAPDIKATDFRSGFDMGKSFIMGAAGRPESWFGGGGKAYQTEAEQFGQVPIKDLEERQLLVKFLVEEMVQFQIDQAVIAGRLSPEKGKAGFTVNMPEISKSDLSKMVNGIPQLTTALAVAVSNKWVSRETATRLFAFVSGYLGYEVDAEAEIDAAAKTKETEGYEDYLK